MTERIENLPPKDVIYVNGLERTYPGIPEVMLRSYFAYRGFSMDHARIDYHTLRGDLLQQRLHRHASEAVEERGGVSFVAASAGVSLSLLVFKKLRLEYPEADLALVGLNGWVQEYDLDQLWYTAMKRPGKKPAPAFHELVRTCSGDLLPTLTNEDKRRIRTVVSIDDEVVPIEAMRIPGVKSHKVPARNHVNAIVMGTVRSPSYLQQIYGEIALKQD